MRLVEITLADRRLGGTLEFPEPLRIALKYDAVFHGNEVTQRWHQG